MLTVISPHSRTMVSQRASQGKVVESSPEEEVDEIESSDEEEQEWEARAILDEKTIPNPDYRKPRSNSHSSRSKTAVPPTIIQYLIDWEGVDPDTGKPWVPSWENGDGATQGLIDDWERQKKEDPDIVGRYTRQQEEKRRKSRRKSSGKQSDSQRKESSKRAASGSASKADVSSGAPRESPWRPAEKDEPQQPAGSPSPAKSTLSDRPIRNSQPSKRKIVVSPPTTTSSGKRTQDDAVAVSDKGDSSSKRDSRGKYATSEGSKRVDDRRQGKRRETALGDSVSRLQDRERQASTVSPKSTEFDPVSRKRKTVLDSDDETESPTITARTTSSRTGSTVRDDDQRQAKKQKTTRDKPEKGSRREDKDSRTNATNEGSRSTSRNHGPGETLEAIRAMRDHNKTRDRDARVATPDTSSARKKEEKSAREPPSSEAKETGKKAVTFDHSQSTNSPSIVGDSQPPLTSSGESRASQRTPSQRTPPDLAQSTDVRRLAISGAMTQASLGSPARPGQGLPLPLVNAEADPSTKTETPAAAPMEVDQEFVHNSLFAMEDDGGSDHSSPDMPQSQAVALQRAIDLLMMEDNFLEEAKAKEGHTPEPTVAEPPAIQENQVPIVTGREARSDSVNQAVSDHTTAAVQAKEPSKRAPRKPFSAVDDFVAPAPPAPPGKQAQSVSDQAAAVKQPNAPKELHPVPHLAPSVFRNVGLSGTPESFMNTQADSIHDFESPHRDVRVPETTVEASSEAAVAVSEKVSAVDATVQTEMVVEQMTTEVSVTNEKPPATMDDEEESQLPELGEDDWSRVGITN